MGSPRTDVRQSRIAGHGHAPALVVREVQVQSVQTVPRRHLDQPLDINRRDELPGEVDVETPPSVTRLVATVDRAELAAPVAGQSEQCPLQRPA